MAYVPTISTDNGMGCISTNGDNQCVFGEAGIVISGNLLTSPVSATISQTGLSTTNPNGFDIQSNLNMNGNTINNMNEINGSGNDLQIQNTNNIYIDAGSDTLSLSGNQINLDTAGQPINLNSTYSDIKMNATNGGIYITDTNMTIEYSPAGVADVGLILKQTNASPTEFTTLTSTSVAYSDSSTTTSTTWLDIITSANAGDPTLTQVLVAGNTATNSIALNNTGTGTNVISLLPNATANNPNITLTDGTTTNTIDKNGYTTRNTTANATHYLNFSDNSTTGTGSIQKTAGISCNPSTNTITATTFSGLLSTGGLVYLSTGSQSITGSASATNISLSGIFNSTYKNYRIVLAPTTQVSFTAYPNYSLTAFSGSGTLPTTASLYGFEMISSSTAVVSPVYTASATISSAPLVLAVSQLVNHQTIIEVENVGYSATATQSIGLKCKSFYNNPGITGASDRSISAVNISGSTITGLTLQQSAITAGNNMTIGWTIYAYK